VTSHNVCNRCSVRHSPKCPEPRWPIQPLAALIAGSVKETFGIDAETLRRYRTHGIPESVADRWAVRLGRHPAEVWPGWIEEGLSVVDEQFLKNGWRRAWEATNEKEQAA